MTILIQVFPRARKGVAKVAVIIIDGEEDKNRGWRNSVLLLKKMGVRVVLVGVGSDALRSSLLPLVENKADLVLTSSFNDMMRNAVDLAKTTCNAAGKWIFQFGMLTPFLNYFTFCNRYYTERAFILFQNLHSILKMIDCWCIFLNHGRNVMKLYKKSTGLEPRTL